MWKVGVRRRRRDEEGGEETALQKKKDGWWFSWDEEGEKVENFLGEKDEDGKSFEAEEISALVKEKQKRKKKREDPYPSFSSSFCRTVTSRPRTNYAQGRVN